MLLRPTFCLNSWWVPLHSLLTLLSCPQVILAFIDNWQVSLAIGLFQQAPDAAAVLKLPPSRQWASLTWTPLPCFFLMQCVVQATRSLCSAACYGCHGVFEGCPAVATVSQSVGRAVLQYNNGLQQYAQWAVGPTAQSQDFYDNPTAQTYYRNHVKTVLNRVNTINGRTCGYLAGLPAWHALATIMTCPPVVRLSERQPLAVRDQLRATGCSIPPAHAAVVWHSGHMADERICLIQALLKPSAACRSGRPNHLCLGSDQRAPLHRLPPGDRRGEQTHLLHSCISWVVVACGGPQVPLVQQSTRALVAFG